ncbi:ATP synthase subunit I [uncultured Photobacterium sp.]|uniref:ATP synthase subunit I n=1 Tax=uncultured Photobacterium sp. TaxID=173973 RepID=UPI0026357E10|nr:ATP synthase subunit I [uncultured Photobacterium sp.]
MKADSGCNDIISAAKIILLGQLIFGFLFIIFIYITNNSFGVKSAIIGVAIAVIPSLLGLGSAAYKLKMNIDVSIRYLAKLNSLVKWVYTALMILTVVRFISVDNKIMLLAYSVTFLGCFLTPILNKPQFRMT